MYCGEGTELVRGNIDLRKKNDACMTLKEILSGESKNLEFKVQRPKASSKYMKSVAAFWMRRVCEGISVNRISCDRIYA